MNLTVKRFMQIEQLYHSMNIYRCMIIYDTHSIKEFENLQHMMVNNDYIFGHPNGRIYNINIDDTRLDDNEVEWSSISLIIDISNEKRGKELVVCPNMIKLCDFCLLINI
jgi:hypothetical protein